jgi:hypothetical protein
MSFLKYLFGKRNKAPIEPMHGGPIIQTQEEMDVTRHRMESEMANQKAARDEAPKS